MEERYASQSFKVGIHPQPSPVATVRAEVVAPWRRAVAEAVVVVPVVRFPKPNWRELL
jgi:hypothetical protein